ncbi:MAG: glutamine amidotransferase, partial [Thermoproteota archaeon]|nr:glutamine amidotransferase [Thermoproteota archaeon]
MVILVVDNTSPFSSNILACLDHLDKVYVYKRFSEVTDADVNQCDRVILSGRRKHNRQINLINSRIIRYCNYSGKSLLGICYGAEIIALTLGGSICKMPAYVHGL